jgi:uncharacterized PurR-regulated membrane protein YhhQ (DUF165 family)
MQIHYDPNYQHKQTIGEWLELAFGAVVSLIVSSGVAYVFVQYLSTNG